MEEGNVKSISVTPISIKIRTKEIPHRINITQKGMGFQNEHANECIQ